MGTYEARVRLLKEYNVDVEKNTSNVDLVFEFRRTDYSYYGMNLDGNAYWAINCAGQVSGNRNITFNWNIPQNEWKEIGRYGFIIPHNADGTKTIDFNGYMFFGDGVAPGSVSASGSLKLTTIPRATTPSLSEKEVYAGEKVSINTPRASSAFTHTLKYTFGDISGIIAEKVGTTYEWSIPISILEGIPNATTGTCTVQCQTYNGTTLIGTKSVKLTINAPDSVVPIINSVTISETVDAVYFKFGTYVKNKSKARVVADVSGVNGSTISTCKVALDGKNYTGTDITTGVISSSGTVPIDVVVTDSRGRAASKREEISVLDYFNPSVLALSAVRCTSAGEEDDEGTALKLKSAFKISELENKNTNEYKFELKKEGDSEWTSILSGCAYVYDNTNLFSSIVLNADYSYAIRITLTDFFTSTVTEIRIGTAFTLVDHYRDGKGIAFGKVAEKSGYMEVNLIAEFLKDVIVHSGNSEYNLAEKISTILKELSEKSPKSHISTENIYGVGDEENYGHVKLADDLNRSKYEDGVALSAYQGYILGSDKLNKKWEKLKTVANNTNSIITVENLEKYSEFMIAVGPITNNNTLARVLASAIIPKSKLIEYTSDHPYGAHQAVYNDGSNKFQGGISYIGEYQIKIYGADSSYTEVWAR